VTYTIDSSDDLLSWTGLLITNLPSPSLDLSDVHAAVTAHRFYRAHSAN